MPSCELCHEQTKRRQKLLVEALQKYNATGDTKWQQVVRNQEKFLLACKRCTAKMLPRPQAASAACYACQQAVKAKNELWLRKFARQTNIDQLVRDCQSCEITTPEYRTTLVLLQQYAQEDMQKLTRSTAACDACRTAIVHTKRGTVSQLRAHKDAYASDCRACKQQCQNEQCHHNIDEALLALKYA
jgi:hypothetical protein